jgi:hypothetical protein
VKKSCTVGGLPYGDAPAGVSYEKTSARDREHVLPLALPGTDERDVDVTRAMRGGKEVAFLIALADPDSHVARTMKDEVESASDVKYENDSYGATPVLVVRDKETPSLMVMGRRDCIFYAVSGIDEGTVNAIATGVFK